MGFLFSLKGAHALVNDYWVISTTVPGLKSVIDASSGESTTLAHIQFPEPVNQPRDCHLLVRPNLLVSELRGFVPILGLIAPITRNSFDFRLMQQIVANSSPLETLGPVSVGIDFDDEEMIVEVQVVFTVTNKS